MRVPSLVVDGTSAWAARGCHQGRPQKNMRPLKGSHQPSTNPLPSDMPTQGQQHSATIGSLSRKGLYPDIVETCAGNCKECSTIIWDQVASMWLMSLAGGESQGDPSACTLMRGLLSTKALCKLCRASLCYRGLNRYLCHVLGMVEVSDTVAI